MGLLHASFVFETNVLIRKNKRKYTFWILEEFLLHFLRGSTLSYGYKGGIKMVCDDASLVKDDKRAVVTSRLIGL